MKYITQSELAAKLDISLSHLKYYIQKGAIRTVTKYGKTLCEYDANIEIRKNATTLQK
jgi:predicted site-specific integrase-resolvase